MAFPYVAVTLPPETPPAYSVALLDACSQAYPTGGCRQDGAPPSTPSAPAAAVPPRAGAERSLSAGDGGSGPNRVDTVTSEAAPAAAPGSNTDSSTADISSAEDAVILGSVVWTDDNTAELLIGLPHWRNNRWLERHLDFRVEDQPLERHRALGFALGSLASTIAEVAAREQESRESDQVEPIPENHPDLSHDANASVPLPEQPVAAKPTTPNAYLDPSLWLGVGAASGFAEPSVGGSLGFGLRFRLPWAIHLRARYALETAEQDQVHATSLAFVALGGPILKLGWLETRLAVGLGLDLINIRSTSPNGKALSSSAWAFDSELTLLPTDLRFAPFVTIGTALGQSKTTDIPGVEYSTLRWQAQLGLAVRFGGQPNVSD